MSILKREPSGHYTGRGWTVAKGTASPLHGPRETYWSIVPTAAANIARRTGVGLSALPGWTQVATLADARKFVAANDVPPSDLTAEQALIVEKVCALLDVLERIVPPRTMHSAVIDVDEKLTRLLREIRTVPVGSKSVPAEGARTDYLDDEGFWIVCEVLAQLDDGRTIIDVGTGPQTVERTRIRYT